MVSIFVRRLPLRLVLMAGLLAGTPIILYLFPQMYKLFLTATFVIPPRIREINMTAVTDRQFYITEGSSTVYAIYEISSSYNTRDSPHLVRQGTTVDFDAVLANEKYKIILYLCSEHRDPYEKFYKFYKYKFSSVLFANDNVQLQIVAFEYKGFGNSAGETISASAVEDTRTVYNWLRKRAPKSEIHVWAHGIGGGYASAAVLSIVEDDKQEVKSLVLEAPYTNPTVLLERRFRLHFVYGKILPKEWLPLGIVISSLRNILLWFDTNTRCPIGLAHAHSQRGIGRVRGAAFEDTRSREIRQVKHHPGFEATDKELRKIIEGFHEAIDIFWTPES